MIEFDRSQNGGVRKVVQEFRAFVEERCIVLVTFQEEMLSPAQLKAAAEVLRDSANQKRGLQASAMKNLRQHRRGGGLAMCALNDHHFLIAQELVMQDTWQGAERSARVACVRGVNVCWWTG